VLSQVALAPLAGLLTAAAGYRWAFAANAASFAFSAVLLGGLRAGEAPSARHAGRRSAAALGVLGSLACTASMIAAAVGVGGPAASMAGMTDMATTGSGHTGGALGALVRIGPWLIVASALLVSAAFALTRRPVTAVPALVAGTPTAQRSRPGHA